MSQFFEIHPDNPQQRLLRQAADIIRNGGVAVYPTDSTYAIGCRLTDWNALSRIRNIRKLKDSHLLTIVCKDLSVLSTYARVSNACYRLVKRNTPGPFTFILNATLDVPRKVVGTKRRTIGLRIPENRITHALLNELDEPLLSTTLVLPGSDTAMTDPHEIRVRLEREVDIILDGGIIGPDPTTLVDLTDEVPQVVRQGIGELLGL